MNQIFNRKRNMKKIALLFALLIPNFISADILLHVGNLLDTENGEISKAVTIRVKDNRYLRSPKVMQHQRKMMRLLI